MKKSLYNYLKEASTFFFFKWKEGSLMKYTSKIKDRFCDVTEWMHTSKVNALY